MTFHSYDALRIYLVVARHGSITSAAAELGLTKSSVSYRVRMLEKALGFPLFERQRRRLRITARGDRLRLGADFALGQLERYVLRLQKEEPDLVSVAAPPRFLSRWLSTRLMTFMANHPGVAVQIEPLVRDPTDPAPGVDVCICRSEGDRPDRNGERLFTCPARPVANAALARRVREDGLDRTLRTVPLLLERASSRAWQRWYRRARLPYRPSQQTRVIENTEERWQAAMDGRGVALSDDLLQDELQAGRLYRLSDVALEDVGYYFVLAESTVEPGPAAVLFTDWLRKQA